MTQAAVQSRRTILVLAAIQALSVSAGSIILSLGTLVGSSLASDASYATLPYALMLVGALLFTVPASRLMFRFGRQAVFVLGAGIGCVSGILMALGAASHSFPLFSLGAFLWGPNAAIILYYRFAATEAVNENQRGRALSFVLSGSIVGVFVGPTVALHLKNIVPGWEYLGSFAFISLQCVLVAVLLRYCTRLAAPNVTKNEKTTPPAVVFLSPQISAGVINNAVAFGVMVLIMTAAPLAMTHSGHSVETSVAAIQWHLCAMYAPSYIAGTLLDRFGAPPVALAGVVLLGAAILVSALDLTALSFTLSLVLLGVGWNFMFVSATYLLSKHEQPNERSWVQAANELLCGTIVALAAFLAGSMLTHMGWRPLVIAALLPLAISLAVTVRAFLDKKREPRLADR